MSERTVLPCSTCGRHTPHLRPSTSHVLHLILSILTMGWWVLIWIIVAANNSTQAPCTECGRKRGLFGIGGKGIPTGPTPETHVKCPDCRELVLREARVCKHCGCKLVPQQ